MHLTLGYRGSCDLEFEMTFTQNSSRSANSPLLEVVNLKTWFDTLAGTVRSVDGVSYQVYAGKTLGIVGESGCGKSVTALSILRLVPTPPARHSGQVLFQNQNLLDLPEHEMRKIRGNQISMVFQEPMTSLNPVMSIGKQISETVRLHEKLSQHQAIQRSLEMLRLVQIPEPERRLNEYPHQLSGGMRQRVMIALALVCNPQILIADEPTTALDVTIQAQILALIKRLRMQLGMGVILITHDLGVVAESCDRVAVMYAGKKVEEANVYDLFDQPLHPYTKALMSSMPSMNKQAKRLTEIPGMVPSPKELGKGCAFFARCSHSTLKCQEETPQLTDMGSDHVVACFAVTEEHVDPIVQAQ